MKLNDEEQDILAGKAGPVPQQALKHQIKVGDFFAAKDFVPVTQAHIMADTESLGEAGVQWLEGLAATTEGQHRVRIPTITDPRGTDFAHADWLGQTSAMVDLERRAIVAFEKLGVAMTNTCINYQTIQPPTRNEHTAFGDTGVVIYANSVCGARSNFEGGPSALSAGLTGRTPRYGFHLPEQRRGTLRIQVDHTPTSLNGWGGLGGVIGRLAGNYWAVPVIEGIEGAPRSDQLKHFGASMASFGSIALYHIVGVTPEASKFSEVAANDLPVHRVTRADVEALQKSYHTDDTVDVVVFSAPQLSLYELGDLATLCDGRTFSVPMLAVTSPQVKPDSDRMGYTARIEAAGGHVLSGMCFYQSYAREISEARGWKRLATNSAKLVNILGGYGYRPMLGLDGSLRRGRGHRKIGADMSARIFKARHAMGPVVRGPALVASDGFSARYDLDRIKGIFSRPAHKLAGQSYVGRVLVLDTAKGGVATAWMLHEMKSRGIVPLALVLNSVNPILAQGAALGEVAMLAGFDADITASVPDGAEVEVNPAEGWLKVS
jgi:predicted aconitase/predicted aconitase with swiveling domain